MLLRIAYKRWDIIYHLGTRGAVEEQHEEAIDIRVASLASKAPNFSILASFDAVWLLKIWFGFSLFSGFF